MTVQAKVKLPEVYGVGVEVESDDLIEDVKKIGKESVKAVSAIAGAIAGAETPLEPTPTEETPGVPSETLDPSDISEDVKAAIAGLLSHEGIPSGDDARAALDGHFVVKDGKIVWRHLVEGQQIRTRQSRIQYSPVVGKMKMPGP